MRDRSEVVIDVISVGQERTLEYKFAAKERERDYHMFLF